MRSCYSSLETPAALLLLIIALFLLLGQTVIFLLSLRETRSKKQMLAASIHFMASFLIFVVMLESYDLVNYPAPKITRNSIPLSDLIQSVPWLSYVVLEGISALFLVLHFREYRHYRKTTVTPDAIRQTVDLLPEGICVSTEDGTALLVNLKMNALCRALTGERHANARKLWEFLENGGEDQEGKRLIHTPQGETWLFAREHLAIEGGKYERISAVNVTERYRITEELREKNAHLHDIQRRMKEAADLSAEMFVKQEEATARSALHNELGQVLLMGRRFIEYPDSTDAAMVSLMTKQMNSFLLGESKTSEPDPDAGDELVEAVRMAGSIGVAVEINGEIQRECRVPKERRVRGLLAQAIRECAANNVKHAEGDRLFVDIIENEAKTLVTITNNGKPPKGPITESGGLLSLRRSVESADGQMIVQSLPAFSLTLTFPHS